MIFEAFLIVRSFQARRAVLPFPTSAEYSASRGLLHPSGAKIQVFPTAGHSRGSGVPSAFPKSIQKGEGREDREEEERKGTWLNV